MDSYIIFRESTVEREKQKKKKLRIFYNAQADIYGHHNSH